MSLASSQFAPTPVSSLRGAASTRSYNPSSASTAGSQKSFLESVISDFGDLVKLVCKPFVKFGRLISRKEGKTRRIDPKQFGLEYAEGVRRGNSIERERFDEIRNSLEEEKRYTRHLENELERSRSSPALSEKEIKEKKQAEERMFGRS